MYAVSCKMLASAKIYSDVNFNSMFTMTYYYYTEISVDKSKTILDKYIVPHRCVHENIK